MSLDQGIENTQDRLAHAAVQVTNSAISAYAQVMASRTPPVIIRVNSAPSALSTAQNQIKTGVPVDKIKEDLLSSAAAQRSSDPEKFANQTLGLAIARASLEEKRLNGQEQQVSQQRKPPQKTM